MPDETTRRRFLAATGALGSAALAGCGSSNAPDEQDDGDTPTDGMGDTTSQETDTTTTAQEEKEYTGGTLQIAAEGRIQTVDPTNGKGSGAGYKNYAESLMAFPNGFTGPEGRLAESYEVSNGGRTYTFKLKEGVKFHDGSELTAADVVYSWERLAQSENSRNKDDIIGSTFTMVHERDPPRSETDDSSLEDYVPGSLGVEATGEYTVEMTMEEAFHATISQVAGGAFAIVPEGIVGDIEGYDGEMGYKEFAGGGLVSTAPFKIGSWSKGDQLKLKRFEDYHGEGPYIDGITYTVLSSSDARYRRAKNGNLDVFSIPTSKFDPDRRTIENNYGTHRTGTYEMSNGTEVNYGESTTLNTTYMLFNCIRTPRPVRKAIAHVLNPHQIARDNFKGTATPGYHLTPPPAYPGGVDAYAEHAKDGYPYGFDAEQFQEAKQVMEEAGYGPDNKAEVKFTVFAGSKTWDQIAKLVRDKAQTAYINMTIEKADFGTIISRAIDGTMDMFSLSDGMEWAESDNFLRFIHPSTPSPSFTRWGKDRERSEWNETMQTAEQAWQKYLDNRGPGDGNQKARNEAYVTIEEMNWESVQELPLIHSYTQRYWTEDVNVPMGGPFAGATDSQTFNTVTFNK